MRKLGGTRICFEEARNLWARLKCEGRAVNNASNWKSWPVYWSGIWVGVLTALAVGLLIGLLGFAFGAHEVAQRIDWDTVSLISLAFSIGSSFFAFVAGGWVASE